MYCLFLLPNMEPGAYLQVKFLVSSWNLHRMGFLYIIEPCHRVFSNDEAVINQRLLPNTGIHLTEDFCPTRNFA